MNLPPIVTHRSVTLSSLLKMCNIVGEQKESVVSELSESSNLTWGDNYASLVTAKQVAEALHWLSFEDRDQMSCLSDLRVVLGELLNQGILVDLES